MACGLLKQAYRKKKRPKVTKNEVADSLQENLK